MDWWRLVHRFEVWKLKKDRPQAAEDIVMYRDQYMSVYYIEHNGANRPCHPRHFMPLVLFLPLGRPMILVTMCVRV